jgi:phage terminase large subunit-like protein
MTRTATKRKPSAPTKRAAPASKRTPPMSSARRRFEQFVNDVQSGAMPVCLFIRQAVDRHLRDMQRAGSPDFPWSFDWKEVDRIVEFFELLPHIKGKWLRRREAITLSPWQVFYVGSMAGWRDRNSLRRFRESRLYVPRKNGKSTLAAGLALFFAFADGEPGAEVYCGATNETQAWEVFGPARRMAMALPEMCEELGIMVNARNLVAPEDGSKIETIIGQPGDGASPSCAIIDEYHEHANSAQFDTMKTGMLAREHPMLAVISTAGDNLAGPCYADWDMCKNILSGIMENERLFILIFTIDEGEDWTTEAAIRKANPNFNVSVDGETLLSDQREALSDSRKQARFKTKHLNIWVSSGTAYYNIENVRRCENKSLKIEDMGARKLVLGIDLASKVDIASIEGIFLPEQPGGKYARFGWHFIPEAALKPKENAHYRQWHEAGKLFATPGNMIDHEFIYERVKQLASSYNLVELGYDPFQAVTLVQMWVSAGIACTEYRQTVLNMSEAMKMSEAWTRDGKLEWNDDPVWYWCVGNVEAKADAKDNVYPRKAGNDPRRKIDAAVAHIIATGLVMGIEAGNGEGDFDDFLSNPLVG